MPLNVSRSDDGATPRPALRAAGLARAPVTWRVTLAFLFLSVAGLTFVFRGALWGGRLLAPLDVPPNLYAKYQWIDPQAPGIPRNHYVVDMFDFELPRQYVFWRGMQAGEFPWWEPYSDGGHPLVAEAHNNLSDPVRLLVYRWGSFATAYNWTRVVHWFLLGLGMLVLLRHLGFSGFAAVFGALTYQFASGHAFFFFPPNVEGSFLYYPFLWVVWSSFLKTPSVAKVLGSGLLCAAIFAAGNLQSYAYLPLFGGCFCLGYGGRCGQRWKRALQITVGAGLIGALVAAPFVAPQIEIYFRSKRDLGQGYHLASLLSGLLSLSGVFPWALGTFRTLDVSKALGQAGLGFCVYIGTAGALLAVIGMGWQLRQCWPAHPELRVAVLLIACYFGLICSTPLMKLLYTRASDLAVIGLVVCGARGLDLLTAGLRDRRIIRFLVWSNAALCGLALGLNLFAFTLYPRFIPRLKEAVLKREATNVSLDRAPRLRVFQVENLPNEVTVRNPETGLALLSGLSLLALVKLRTSWFLRATVLVLNLCPLLLFGARFIPSGPMAAWQRLLEGGPEQNRLRALAAPGFKRMTEEVPGRFDCLFPGVTACYYGVHTWTGYSAYYLKSPAELAALPPANFRYLSPKRGLEQGFLDSTLAARQLRFVWESENPRRVTIAGETCNSIFLQIDPGPPGTLVRTDSYYPGWRVTTPGISARLGPAQTFAVPSGVTRVELRYRPSHLTATLWLSGGTLALMALAGGYCLLPWVSSRVRSRRITSDPVGSAFS